MWILKQIFFYVKIVWRQSEFAFFVRSLRLTHFFYLEDKMKKKKFVKTYHCNRRSSIKL